MLACPALSTCVAVVATCLAGTSQPADCNLTLHMKDAVARHNFPTQDLALEFEVRGGRWSTTGWGYGPFNRGHHEANVTRDETADGVRRLTLEVRFGSDPWVAGGSATYTLELKPEGEGWAGTYTGQFRDALGVDPVAVKGAASSTRAAAWPEAAPGHVPLAPGEHPRLIFRKSDLATLKRRAAETPEGRAIMAQLAKVITAHEDEGGKFGVWAAVGYGFAWQMTGEAAHLAKARDIIAANLGPGSGQDIHHAPRATGLALAYDLCYDGLDPAFRGQVTDELQTRLRELSTGKTRGGQIMGGLNLATWSNHNGIRAAAYGLCALALLGEQNSKGQPILEADRLARLAARELRDYVQLGLGGGDWGMEGMFYKGMTLRRGVLQALRAYQVAQGLKLDGGDLGDFIAVGHLLEAEPGRLFRTPREWDGLGPTYDVDDDTLHDVLFGLGAVTVPADMLPGWRSVLDQAVGLKGSGTFGIPQGLYAPYALVGYPFDTPPKPPGEAFRWWSPDPVNGHYVFRPQYRDEQDFLVATNFRFNVRGSCHNERAGEHMGLQVIGLGRTWIDGPSYVDTGVLHPLLGPEHVATTSPEDRVAIVTMKLDRLYTQPADRKGNKPAVDKGYGGVRSLLVDFTGKCGAPALIVIADRLTGVEQTRWQLAVREVTADGATFTAGAAPGPNLRGLLLGPREVRLQPATLPRTPMKAKPVPGLTAAGAGEYLAVLTIQDGAAPPIQVDGSGLAAKLTIGGRTVHFDGQTLTIK